MDTLFMPHGHCYLWQPALVWLQVLTNGAIGIAYVVIAGMLAYLVHKGQYVPFKGMALAFGIFIVSCGITHFIDVWVIWDPIYWTDGAIRAVTAVASVSTAFMLPALVPRAIQLAQGAKRARDRGVQLETALAEMGTAYERTRELERMKTEFFANVSHELRTPLALILGPAQRLLESGSLDERQRGDVDLIQRNAKTLLEQVNDLLDIAKFDAGKLEAAHSRIDLASKVRALASNFEGLASDREIRFVVAVPDRLEAEVDLDKIQRIVLNLLSNAFKHAPSQGTVRCSLTSRDRGTRGEVVLEIADSGPGIAPEHRERVFERFGQLDASAPQHFGGTGLGLAIAKDFTAVHGGTIEATEAPEGGALLRVVLPRRAPKEAAVSEPESSEPTERSGAESEAIAQLETTMAALARDVDAERPRILVVEDNPDMNLFVSEILEADYRVERAFHGRAGLEHALARPPDLVVSDIMMPEMSGDQLVRAIRAHDALDAIPILLLTAKADDELRVELLRDGAQDYLMKPFDANELRARVRNLVTVKRARDVLQRAITTQTTDLERLAEEVTLHKRELELALDSMRVAKEQAERASQLKSDFLGMVSHELRTPLSALMLQLARMRVDEDKMEPEGKRLLERMDVQTSRLHDLIESLLEYARVHAGKLPVSIAAVDVGDLARSVASDLRPQAEAKGLELVATVDGSTQISSDRRLLRLVLVNLVSNAVKFTSTGSVTIAVRPATDGLDVSVADTGPGIPDDQRTEIFEPFRQLGNPRHKHLAGVGLGLALVREMVDALGGEIELESAVGRGTTFTVRMRSVKVEPERHRG